MTRSRPGIGARAGWRRACAACSSRRVRTCGCGFEVAPGPRLRAGEIRVESGGRSRPGMIRRAVVVEPGAIDPPAGALGEPGTALGAGRLPLGGRAARAAAGDRPRAQGRAATGRGVRAERPSRRRARDAPQGRRASGAAGGESRREAVSDIVVSYVERPDVTLEYGLRYSTLGLRRSRRRALLARQRTPAGRRRPRAREPARLGLAPPPLRPADDAIDTRSGPPLESATLFGLRVRTQLLVFDDDDNRDTVSSLASRIRGVSIQQTRALVEDSVRRAPPRQAAPAVGLRGQEDPVLRQQRASRRASPASAAT